MKLIKASTLLVAAMGFMVACQAETSNDGDASSSTPAAETEASTPAEAPAAADMADEGAGDAAGAAAAAVEGTMQITVAVDGMT